MTKKNEKRKNDEFPNFKEFRTVRYYSNINGEEKSYGYNYTNDENGEKYEEVGDPKGFDFEGELPERIKTFDEMLNFDEDFLVKSFRNINRMLPGIKNMFEGMMGTPQLMMKETPTPTQQVNDSNTQDIHYDIQLQDNNELYVIVELPGFSKKDVHLKLKADNKLHVTAENEKKNMETIIPLSYSVDKKNKIKAKMNNGILEVTLKVKGIDDTEEDIEIS